MVQFYRIDEAALLLGVYIKTVRRWDATGNISHLRMVGVHRRISLLEIERVLHHRSPSVSSSNHTRIAIY
ncbi:MAG: excisionase family DNA-binding protein [Promethearchaeota archaeon]